MTVNRARAFDRLALSKFEIARQRSGHKLGNTDGLVFGIARWRRSYARTKL
jgi:hypothetical protein